MADCISREAAIKEFCDDCMDRKWCKSNGESCSRIKNINSVPATDVRPVRRGHWIKDSDGLDICSECEEVALQRVFIKLPEKIVDLQMMRSNFCPNCGADMREVQSNG